MRSPAPTSRRRRGLAGTLAAALVVSPLALGLSSPAEANPLGTGLVISEVYGAANLPPASFGNDFIEIYNPTTSTVDLAGWSVQYHSATGTGAFAVTPLTGKIPAGKHYLVQEGNFTTGTQLPAPDATGSIALSSTSGVVALVSNTTPYPTFGSTTGVNLAGVTANGLVDVVGYGSTANTYEAVRTGVNQTNILSSQRTLGADSDNNDTDFSEATPTPVSCGAECVVNAPVIDDVPDKTFIEGEAISSFTITATKGTTPYAWSQTGLPAGLTLDATSGVVSGTPTAAGSSSVTVTVTDAAGEKDTDTFSVTVKAAPVALTPIAGIQGTGATSPLAGEAVKTQGVVTAAYPTGGLNGFYIQTPGPDTANASDAVFVYGGTSGFATYPAVDSSVEVTGLVAEFGGATQVVAGNSGVDAIATLGTVTAKTQVPGTDCALPGTSCQTAAALAVPREAMEGELLQPAGSWTVTDSYDGSPDLTQDGENDGSFRGELAVVANSNDPLVAPTEIIDAQDKPAIDARKAYNAAHRLILDDASSWTYSRTEHQNDPFPWFTVDHSVRTGAAISFVKPVVFTERNGSWRVLPQEQVVGKPTGMIGFEQTRPAAPQPVGGDLKLATFNVLNFFPTTGEEFVASGAGTCQYFRDRDNNPISNQSCTNNGPRGAATTASLARQRDKIVRAINTADADIVSLEELENSVKYNKPRDFAIDALVTALNADAGAGTWAAVPSAAVLPPTSEQDVIRNGFIYQPASVSLVGDSVVLSDQSSAGEAFEDAREPVAQAFKRTGTADSEAFAVIVNHFKSKGSGTADPDGQGNANDRRKIQAAGLVTFADEFKTQRNLSKVFLAGDFNAYSEEDPIQILKAAGYTNLESTSDPDEKSYSFDGMVGSLDHVLANNAALATVQGVDIWDINAYESVYYEYARFNTNITNLYAPNAFRSSDHNPEIVGIKAPLPAPVAVDTTVTGTAPSVAYGQAGSVTVKVAPATATGTVTLSLAGTAIGSTTLTSGAGTIAVPAKALPPGTYTLALSYAGDAGHKASTGTVTHVVTKAVPTVTTKVKPKKVKAGKTRARVVVTVEADGYTPTGKIRIRVAGEVYRAKLVDGKAVVKLKKIDKPRRYTVKVRYRGDANTEATRTTVRLRVRQP